MNNKKLFGLLLLVLFVIPGCTKEDFLDFVGVDITPKCRTGSVYDKEFTNSSTYIPPNLEESYSSVVEYENASVLFSVPPKEIGRIAYTISEMHKIMNFPNNDSVRQFLQSGHFIIVSRDDIFGDLLQDDEKASMVGAFIHTDPKYVCWDVPEGANWTTVIREQFWNLENSWIIIHEMLHAVAYKTYGTSDPGHTISKIWDTKDPNALFYNVIIEYDSILSTEYNTSIIVP